MNCHRAPGMDAIRAVKNNIRYHGHDRQADARATGLLATG